MCASCIYFDIHWPWYMFTHSIYCDIHWAWYMRAHSIYCDIHQPWYMCANSIYCDIHWAWYICAIVYSVIHQAWVMGDSVASNLFGEWPQSTNQQAVCLSKRFIALRIKQKYSILIRAISFSKAHWAGGPEQFLGGTYHHNSILLTTPPTWAF